MEKKNKNRVDIPTAIKEASAHTLISVLKSIPGLKDLVLDDDTISFLDFISNVHLLKQCDVQKIYKLDPVASPGQSIKCVYLVRPSLPVTKIIADHINANQHLGKFKEYWIIYVPRKLHICEMVLEREGVYGYATIMEYPVGFVPMDSDLLSLEISDFFPTYFLEGDQRHVYTAAMALVWLQKLCGTIPNIYGQGKCASMVVDLMKTIMEETKCDTADNESISHLIIIDRDIDYVSTLLTQLTYEGLLDETFGIKGGKVVFGKDVTGRDQPVKVVLNSNDVIYNDIRYCHFTSVIGILKGKTKHLQKKSETAGMSVVEMKHFVTNEMKSIQQQRTSLALHIGACEKIVNEKNKRNFQELLRTECKLLEGVSLRECLGYIEETINRRDFNQFFKLDEENSLEHPALCSLRLLCLMSVTQDGLSPKDYKSLVVQFVQSYGHKHLITFQNLKKIGLFVEQVPVSLPVTMPYNTAASKIAGRVVAAVSGSAFPRRSSFKAVSKKLMLVHAVDEDYDLKNPKDVSYVFGGSYIPLACKLTEQLIQNDGFQNLEDAVKLLPGTTICYKSFNKLDLNSSGRLTKKQSDFPSSKTVMVYFLGGVTYSEVAALRFLSKAKDYPILVATTSLISGNSLLHSLMPESSRY